MRYAEFLERSTFSKAELLALAHGVLVEDAPHEITRVPLPPMLMFDRVVELTRDGQRGRVVAELDVKLDAWYFQCHFAGDPVQPGCLGVDGVWQILGLFMAASGCPGTGRALGCKEVDFFGQIRPHDGVVTYTLDVRRLARLKATGASLALADASVAVDGERIYTVQQAKVGTFLDIRYPDYPLPGRHARGGIMDRR